MIEVENLVKVYADLRAVDGLSLRAQPGQIFGLLGPNGAGKSTTIGCISGLVNATQGRITIDGHDALAGGNEAKRVLGVVPQELALYDDLSANENLRFWAGVHGLRGTAFKQRAGELLDAVGLTDRAQEPVSNFSGGMQRRLNFACGVIHNPKLLLCDEPTVGVDPQSRVHLLDLVKLQRDAGTCVIYTTHYMEEAEELCDRLMIVDNGKAIAEGTLNELREQAGEVDMLQIHGRFTEASSNAQPPNLDESAVQNIGFQITSVESNRLQFTGRDASRHLPALFAQLTNPSAGAAFEIHETNLRRPSLESLFIKLTGRELRE